MSIEYENDEKLDTTTGEVWKDMYMLLFHGIEEALDTLPATVENLPVASVLKKALLEAEERYMNAT